MATEMTPPVEDRQQAIDREILDAVDEQGFEALQLLEDLRDLGVLTRPTYRLSSPYGSGMSHLAED